MAGNNKAFRRFKMPSPARIKAVQERVHARVLGATSIEDMWRLFFDEVISKQLNGAGVSTDDPAAKFFVKFIQDGFYSGAASMLDLMTKISANEISEDDGAVMLEAYHREATAYAKRIGGAP